MDGAASCRNVGSGQQGRAPGDPEHVATSLHQKPQLQSQWHWLVGNLGPKLPHAQTMATWCRQCPQEVARNCPRIMVGH